MAAAHIKAVDLHIAEVPFCNLVQMLLMHILLGHCITAQPKACIIRTFPSELASACTMLHAKTGSRRTMCVKGVHPTWRPAPSNL